MPNSRRLRTIPSGCFSNSTTSLRSSSASPLRRTTSSRAATSNTGDTRPWQLGTAISTLLCNARFVPALITGQIEEFSLEIRARPRFLNLGRVGCAALQNATIGWGARGNLRALSLRSRSPAHAVTGARGLAQGRTSVDSRNPAFSTPAALWPAGSCPTGSAPWREVERRAACST